MQTLWPHSTLKRQFIHAAHDKPTWNKHGTFSYKLVHIHRLLIFWDHLFNITQKYLKKFPSYLNNCFQLLLQNWSCFIWSCTWWAYHHWNFWERNTKRCGGTYYFCRVQSNNLRQWRRSYKGVVDAAHKLGKHQWYIAVKFWLPLLHREQSYVRSFFYRFLLTQHKCYNL